MQYSKLAFIAVLAAPLVSAQTVTIADLPSCALQPALTALGATGCATTDIGCACKNQAFVNGLTTTVQSVCSPADQAKTIQVAQGLCSQAGVTLTLPSNAGVVGGSSSTSAAAVSTASATSTSVSSVVVSSTTVVKSSTASSSPATTPVVPMGTGNAGNGTVGKPTATTSAFTGAAAVATAVSGPLAAGGIFGVAALLLAL